jgi:hypothetical protein
MLRTTMLGTCLVFLFTQSVSRAAEEGKVTLPLSTWEEMLSQIESYQKPNRAPQPFYPIERKIEGTFRKGLLSANLAARFEVTDDQGHVRVPVIDGAASLADVLLDGKPTSLLREGGMYTLGLDRSGVHEVRLRFYWGQEQDRFTRRVRFQLPDAGVTEVSLVIPEEGIEASLAHGALRTQEETAGGTRLEGHLDAYGLFDLSWNRKITHRSKETAKMEAGVRTLITVQEAMISGLAVFDVKVLQGEIDHLELRLPAEVEVVKVEGDAVLQWHTEASAGGRLTVLLRYVVENESRVAVHFQFPSERGKPIQIRQPLPPEGVPMTGLMGVQGPAGLNVQIAELKNAQAIDLRDLPTELADLTASPLLFGFSFTEEPQLKLTAVRNQELALKSTVIDELLASTVIIEDGSEVTKMKVRIRNNARQYLTLHLPENALLTHALIDGRPIRPAVTGEGEREALLFPLRQSERIGNRGFTEHVVRDGETLSDIANQFYSDPSLWRKILDKNRDQLPDETSVYAGQRIKIPSSSAVTVEESSFVIELAYKQIRKPLGNFGCVALLLPEMDVDIMKATWHLYFPEALSPLSFSANLTQYSAIRYDWFRRIRSFLLEAFFERDAWAGGGYVSVLKQRKAIYNLENMQKESGEMILSSFPLVGHRYRFRRSLLGSETPAITITYAAKDLGLFVRWGAFLAALAATFALMSGKNSLRARLTTAALLLVLLLLAYYFLGVHRRMLWGADLALLIGILRLRAGTWWHESVLLLYAPWTVTKLVTLHNLFFVTGLCVLVFFISLFPLLLSTAALPVLFFWYRRKTRLAREEVAHA